MIPYMDAVVAVTVIRVVLHVCMLRGCEGDGNAGVGDRGGVVVVSAGHMGGTGGSGIVSSADDVLWMRGGGGVCEMCMCLARGGVGGEGVSGPEDLGWALQILWEQEECWTCVCWLRWCRWLGTGYVGVWLCYVCVSSESGFFV